MKRNPRNPENYDCVTEWGFTHVAWTDFVKRFPEQARSLAESYTEDWTSEEVAQCGGPDVLAWTELYDDECFLNKAGEPLVLGNITGPGGYIWLAYVANEGWDEVVLDDDGNPVTV